MIFANMEALFGLSRKFFHQQRRWPLWNTKLMWSTQETAAIYAIIMCFSWSLGLSFSPAGIFIWIFWLHLVPKHDLSFYIQSHGWEWMTSWEDIWHPAPFQGRPGQWEANEVIKWAKLETKKQRTCANAVFASTPKRCFLGEEVGEISQATVFFFLIHSLLSLLSFVISQDHVLCILRNNLAKPLLLKASSLDQAVSL